LLNVLLQIANKLGLLKKNSSIVVYAGCSENMFTGRERCMKYAVEVGSGALTYTYKVFIKINSAIQS
jgi:hypothetical protein